MKKKKKRLSLGRDPGASMASRMHWGGFLKAVSSLMSLISWRHEEAGVRAESGSQRSVGYLERGKGH